MASLIKIRDSIRDFIRKYDEIMEPVLRFVAAFIVFSSIHSLFGYSSLFDKGIVTFLLSVISALVSTPVVVFIAGLVVLMNTFAVSMEVGLTTLVVFIFMYCLYMRMFQEYGFILALVPILCMLKLYYAIPLVILIFGGASGIVPTAFGLILYKYSMFVRTIVDGHLDADEEFQSYEFLAKQLLGDKELLLGIIAFAVVILVAYVLYLLPFDYSWYVAIAVGGVLNILVFVLCGSTIGVDVVMGDLVLGSVIGILVAALIQGVKSLVDYSKKETVQFEDDEYYYYVKAIPKFYSSAKRSKNTTQSHSGKKKSSGEHKRNSDLADRQNRSHKSENAQIAREREIRRRVMEEDEE